MELIVRPPGCNSVRYARARTLFPSGYPARWNRAARKDTRTMDKNKAKGKMNESAGTVRAKAGSATNNEQMEADGKAQHVKGKAQVAGADAKGAVSKAADKVKGALKH